MTSLSNDEKYIQFTFSNEIIDLIDMSKPVYMIKSPKIVCSNKEDAELIQKKLNEFISEISHNILSNKEV